MSALDRQQGGNHYVNQKIQPIELGYMLGQTPAFVKVAKYCTRVKDDPVQQFEKAKHCVELEMELCDNLFKYQKSPVKEAEKLLDEFTEDTLIYSCLLHFHMGHYKHASHLIDQMILRHKSETTNE